MGARGAAEAPAAAGAPQPPALSPPLERRTTRCVLRAARQSAARHCPVCVQAAHLLHQETHLVCARCQGESWAWHACVRCALWGAHRIRLPPRQLHNTCWHSSLPAAASAPGAWRGAPVGAGHRLQQHGHGGRDTEGPQVSSQQHVCLAFLLAVFCATSASGSAKPHCGCCQQCAPLQAGCAEALLLLPPLQAGC